MSNIQILSTRPFFLGGRRILAGQRVIVSATDAIMLTSMAAGTFAGKADRSAAVSGTLTADEKVYPDRQLPRSALMNRMG